jgi:hypothetical protein
VDERTGRLLVGGHDHIEALTDTELEAELTIAVAEPRRRGERLDDLLLERTRRRRRAGRDVLGLSTRLGALSTARLVPRSEHEQKCV